MNASIAERKTRWKLLVLVSLITIAILIGAGATAYVARSQAPAAVTPPPAPPIPVVTRRAENRDVSHVVEVVGTLQALQSVVLRAQVDGILTEVLFKEGDLVRRGQVLARIDDRAFRAALSAAEAQLARDQALLRAAELDLKRARTLLQKNAGSQQVVDQQTAQVDQLKATVALDEANVEAAKVNVSYTEIVSPIEGRIGIRGVDAGNLLRASDAAGIVSIAQVDPISVLFSVPQQVFADLRDHMKMPGAAEVEVMDRAAGTALAKGEIVSFDNQIDMATGTARIRAVLDNGEERLTPGAFVAIRIETGRSPNAVVVPKVAIRPGIEGNFVYRIENGAAARVPVTVGYNNDAVAVVTQGVASGDEIVTDGYSRLRPGAQVVATERPGDSSASAKAAILVPGQ